MKVLVKILGILVGLVILLALIGYTLPSETKVERSTKVAASASAIYPHISHLRRCRAWSPWAAMDPDTEYSYEGPAEGVGAKVSWKSTIKEVGSGIQEIIEAEPNKKVRSMLLFGKSKKPNYADLILDEEGENDTKVTWTFECNAGYNPVMRYFGLFLNKWLGPQYETGLSNLKALVERGSVLDGIEEIELVPQTVVGVRKVTQIADISASMEESFAAVRAYTEREHANETKDYLSVYFQWDEENGQVDYLAAVTSNTAKSDEVEPYTIKGGRYVKGIHQGDYNELPSAHGEINAYIASKNLTIVGPVYEHYVVMQETMADGGVTEIAPTTHIYYPVADAAVVEEAVSTENQGD